MVMPAWCPGSGRNIQSLCRFAVVMGSMATMATMTTMTEQMHCYESDEKQYPDPVLYKPFHNRSLVELDER